MRTASYKSVQADMHMCQTKLARGNKSVIYVMFMLCIYTHHIYIYTYTHTSHVCMYVCIYIYIHIYICWGRDIAYMQQVVQRGYGSRGESLVGHTSRAKLFFLLYV